MMISNRKILFRLLAYLQISSTDNGDTSESIIMLSLYAIFAHQGIYILRV